MSHPVLQAERLTELRSRAAARLPVPNLGEGANAGAADALSVLYHLASSPDTASDALKLMHELQVHQVEIDLQAQEMQESRAELESALRRQIELYDFQPFGCFTIGPDFVLQEVNRAGARLLDLPRHQACGLGLDTFLSPEGVRGLRTAMTRVDEGVPASTCLLRLRVWNGAERAVLASVGADPAARRYLVSLADAGEALEPPGRAA